MDPQHEQKLYSLMVVAEEHQKAVKAVIDGLAVDRAAMAKEYVALAQAIADVRKAAAAVVPAAQKAAGDAVGASVRESLEGAAQAAAEALERATKPVIGRLSGVVQAAKEAEGSMRKAGAWFAWKWVAVATGGLVGVCLVAYAALAWQLHQVEQLGQQKGALAAEIIQLQAKVDTLEKRGGKLVTNSCDGRLCFEVSGNQGKAGEQWKGAPWGDKEKVRGFVIPRGF